MPGNVILETVVVGGMEVNCYIFARARGTRAVIIDPGAEPDKIQSVLAGRRLTPGIVVNTHGHYDHIGADEDFGAPIYAHRDDVAMLKDAALNYSALFSTAHVVRSDVLPFAHGESLECDGVRLKVLHIGGHSPGGSALLVEEPCAGIVFSGDSLFRRSIGRTDFPGGDEELLKRNIRDRIFTLPDETLVLPGHGQPTTVGEERSCNPFFSHA
jgi:glyoxylase-like metal-dependent hydrolase (beta-lactamase superfamily II)